MQQVSYLAKLPIICNFKDIILKVSLMLKKLLIFVVVVIILGIGISIYAIKNANSIIAKYKPEIEATLSKTLKADVTLGELDVKIFPNTFININELKITTDPKSKGLTLKDFIVDIALLPLLKKTLDIQKISILNPIITLIKDSNGIFIDGLPKPEKLPKENKQSAEKQAKSKLDNESKLPNNISVNLEKFALEDAVIKFYDKATNKLFEVKDLNVNSSVELKENLIKITELFVSLNANQQAELAISSKNLQFNLDNFQLEGDIGIDKLNAQVPMAKIDSVKGSINIIANLKEQQSKIDNLSFNINNSKVIISNLTKMNQKSINSSYDLSAFAGKISGAAELFHTSKKQNFTSNLSLSNIQIAEVSKALVLKSPLHISGLLESFSLNLTGNLPSLPKSISGSGKLLLKDGEIKGENIAGKVLSQVKDLPFIAGSLLDAVPEKLRGEIEGEDTPIRSLDSNFTIENSTLNIKDMNLVSTIFSLTANGTIGFDQNLNLNSKITFNSEFSKALIVKVKEVQKLLNDKGELVLPLKITGKIPKLFILPDIKELIKQGATKEIEDKVNKKIDNFLEKKLGKFR